VAVLTVPDREYLTPQEIERLMKMGYREMTGKLRIALFPIHGDRIVVRSFSSGSGAAGLLPQPFPKREVHVQAQGSWWARFGLRRRKQRAPLGVSC
jgi:hypothetical protein